MIFTAEDFKVFGRLSAEAMADISNAKLAKEGVVVYGMGTDGMWNILKQKADTHTALLLNIQPIEPEKPKCVYPHNVWVSEVKFCMFCGERIGS